MTDLQPQGFELATYMSAAFNVAVGVANQVTFEFSNWFRYVTLKILGCNDWPANQTSVAGLSIS